MILGHTTFFSDASLVNCHYFKIFILVTTYFLDWKNTHCQWEILSDERLYFGGRHFTLVCSIYHIKLSVSLGFSNI